jgi:hypothetical protein
MGCRIAYTSRFDFWNISILWQYSTFREKSKEFLAPRRDIFPKTPGGGGVSAGRALPGLRRPFRA